MVYSDTWPRRIDLCEIPRAFLECWRVDGYHRDPLFLKWRVRFPPSRSGFRTPGAVKPDSDPQRTRFRLLKGCRPNVDNMCISPETRSGEAFLRFKRNGWRVVPGKGSCQAFV